ncbi:MAG TPA: DEAD/DEAH box helicase [Gemmatales bacterium]|nr:DEAD/DEAH box helicase [Gemmatales bacterium]
MAETINETLGGAISGVPDPAAVLDLFTPPIRKWFCERVGRPTPPQVLGWPAIHRGDHTLILAPTGSGKTLAAFLACLDQLCRGPLPKDQVQLLYVSPLKALNQDIQRNLRVPLQGVAAAAGELGLDHPELRIAVRTGDTTAAERQALVRRPPHVLITTPETLNLVLTSAARAMLTHLRWCVVDEIHVLCPNKRGVFLALLLERLSALQQGPDFVRIGLSATQRPLDEVARYLGGGTRPVTIVDAGLRKNLDLQVIAPVETFGPLPERTVWPSIYRLLLDQIRTHRSTLIFANSRRTVERVANELNELAAETPTPADASPLAPMRPHHGSLSQEARFATEQALKMGELSAVVATASLELGIDMGAVDLVCQIESPGQVARSLQRVGRAGHLVGQTSKGRLIPKTKADLLEQAVVAREMRLGRVEELRVPTLCLDVLAQQIVAMVAVQSWDVPELLRVLRQAYPYRDLTAEALESVLEMLAGRFPDEAFRELRARLSWDRIHNRLHPLPGSKQLALINGGTIPDTGQFAAYITGTEVRIGELDEEFVYERRLGDVFQLGSHAWRIDEIGSDRVHVSRADGLPPLMPFWRGERAARSPDLGLAIGRFLRELEDRLDQSPPRSGPGCGKSAVSMRPLLATSSTMSACRSKPLAACPAIRPSSWRHSGTNSATGTWPSSLRSAAISTSPSAWPSKPGGGSGMAISPSACTWRTACCSSWWTSTSRLSTCSTTSTRIGSKTWSPPNWAPVPSLPFASATMPCARCSCLGSGPTAGRRSGCSGSRPGASCRSAGNIPAFPWSWRRSASVCTTTSTCLGWPRSCGPSGPARYASSGGRRTSPAPSRPRCSSSSRRRSCTSTIGPMPPPRRRSWTVACWTSCYLGRRSVASSSTNAPSGRWRDALAAEAWFPEPRRNWPSGCGRWATCGQARWIPRASPS